MNNIYIIFNIILLFINSRYLYYWIMVYRAIKEKHISNENFTSFMVENEIKQAKKKGNTYKFNILITTKGGHRDVVFNGIQKILDAICLYPSIKDIISIEVVTENREDLILSSISKGVDIKVFVVPQSYKTKNNTGCKARSLQYMVEERRKNIDIDDYIVHLDEESIFTPNNLIRLIVSLLRNPHDISEGVISYGTDWKKANILCRAIESGRPFGCCECYNLIKDGKAPYHLHGSNLVVKRKVEDTIGWDQGTLKGNDLVAEDLIFGMRAFLKYGKKSFGWHYAEMIEQPPFTILSAVRQRERWVMGTLQGIEYAPRILEYKKLSLIDRLQMKFNVWYSVLTFALSFPLSIFTALINTIVIIDFIRYFVFDGHHLVFAYWTLIFIPGTLMWIMSLQLGLYYNLRYSTLSKKNKAIEHIKILLVTPIAGFVETFGAFKSLIRWSFGRRNLSWIITPKK